MAWVPKYFYDVFLSYAHVDNEGSDKWVSRFPSKTPGFKSLIPGEKPKMGLGFPKPGRGCSRPSMP
jgi:hypothetical protein